MKTDYPNLKVARKKGNEQFHSDGGSIGCDLMAFWQWSASDLLGNTARGRLAEFLVAQALGLAAGNIRYEWDPYDLETKGGLKIEVKSAAYVQSWHQNDLSKISYLVPKRRGWDSTTNILDKEPTRHADVYVFALLAHKEKYTIDPMNIEQWRFYIVPTEVLNLRTRSQHSITLRSLEKLCPTPVKYDGLQEAIESIEKQIIGSG